MLLSTSINFGTTEALDHVWSLTNKSADVLHLVKADSDHIFSNITSTADLVDHVSSKVSEHDLAQSRVNSMLLFLDAIVERDNCIKGVKRALETEDYKAAANYVQTFLRIDEKYKDYGSKQREQLMESKKKLEGIVRKQLSMVVDQRDHPTILRIIRLYTPLGLEEEGLQVYVGYLRKVIGMRSRLEFEHLVELMDQNVAGGGQTQANFVGCLINLFKDIVLAIEENNEILRSFCSEDGIKNMEYRKLPVLSSDINAQKKNLLDVGGSSEGPDPEEVELYSEEILSLMHLGEDYTEFMISKIKGLTSVDAELVSRATKASL
ncbi:hypothetical protein FEM48_Zijuj06G0150000 [Ziziphus jujuba var. spinosa]|uniref:Conserved oligomeric Golgi complex subunit 4 n=1 Tax=Ziziphus jujuba var. spinosa TaxID=714518 RepID=A0A978V9Z0_ZIZJJ|nr:hypothetical protein FEM48_Zijuj06G0150000 [Ziziphus jujuba var. spinosa]